MKKNKVRLKKLILYILQQYNNQDLTETKLQKLLYFCDFENFKLYEASITGYQYRKNHYGPTIMELPAILVEMEREGFISMIQEKTFYGTPKVRFVPMKQYNGVDTDFDEKEILIIDRVNDTYKKLAPREISILSHHDYPYLGTKNNGDIIDYKLAIFKPDERDEEEKDAEAEEFFSSNRFKKTISTLASKLHNLQNATC